MAAHGRGQLNLARIFQHSVLRLKAMPGDEKRVTDWTAFTLHGSFLADPLDIADNGREAADKQLRATSARARYQKSYR